MAGRTMRISTAARSGDQLKLLIALRSRIAKEVEDPELAPRHLVALSRQLRDINKEIQSLKPPEGDFVDNAQQQQPAARTDGGEPF